MTTRTWLFGALLAVAAGATGAALARSLTAAPPAKDGARPVVAPAPDVLVDDDLLRRLDDLERRLAALELRPAPAEREVVVTRDPVDAARPALAADDATAAAGDAVPDDRLLEDVIVALESIRERERREEEAERERIVAQKLDAELELLASKLNLGAGQVNDLRELYYERRAFEDELTRLWEEGHDAESLGRLKQDGFERYERRLDGILTPAQREGLDAHRNARREKLAKGK